MKCYKQQNSIKRTDLNLEGERGKKKIINHIQ